MNNKLLHTDILMNDEVSDHDTPCGIFNIKKKRYEPRYKYVRTQHEWLYCWFKVDFNQDIFGFDDSNDQIAMIKTLLTNCTTDHAPIKKVKSPRPPAPWMKIQS